MSRDPLERLLVNLGIAAFFALSIGILSGILIAVINRARLTCPRCGTRMEEKTDWGEVAKGVAGLAVGLVVGGAIRDLGHGVSRTLGSVAGDVTEQLLQDAAERQFAHLAPRAGDTTYLLCPACRLPKRDDRIGCGLQFVFIVALPLNVAVILLLSQC